MHFTKMHGLGNDYLYVYGEVPENIAELSQKLSERHFGAGSDGMIYISPSDVADFKMRIFNADGSEAKMCGNGIRCVGKYVYDKGYTDRTRLTIETLSGIKTLDLKLVCGKVRQVTVDMGRADVGDKMCVDALKIAYFFRNVRTLSYSIMLESLMTANLCSVTVIISASSISMFRTVLYSSNSSHLQLSALDFTMLMT